MNYLYIDTSSKLDAFCQALNAHPWFAIDTEFVRQDTYYPELSLVQIYTPNLEPALIDPVVIEDLSPLWQKLADPQCIKVFHSARQDIEVLFQLSGIMPNNIFDTQIACVFLGYGDLAGLSRVIEAELGQRLDKAHTRTNWLQRPLSKQQIQYALDDVLYLAPLYEKLLTKLTRKQLNALQSDFKQLLKPELYNIEPDQAWLKLKTSSHFNQKQLGLVKALSGWREQKAIETNQPRKWVISDEAILTLAKRPQRALEGLYKLKELDASRVRQYGESIISVLDFAFQHPENWPQPPTPPPALTANEERLIQLAIVYAHQLADEHHINPANLINKRDLIQLYRQQSGSLTQGWRFEMIGHSLQQLFNQQACLCIENHQIRLQVDAVSTH